MNFRQSIRRSRLFEGNSMRDSKLFKDIEKVAKKYGVTLRLAEFTEIGLRLQAKMSIHGEELFTLMIEGGDVDLQVYSQIMELEDFSIFSDYTNQFNKFIDFVMKLDENDYV